MSFLTDDDFLRNDFIWCSQPYVENSQIDACRLSTQEISSPIEGLSNDSLDFFKNELRTKSFHLTPFRPSQNEKKGFQESLDSDVGLNNLNGVFDGSLEDFNWFDEETKLLEIPQEISSNYQRDTFLSETTALSKKKQSSEGFYDSNSLTLKQDQVNPIVKSRIQEYSKTFLSKAFQFPESINLKGLSWRHETNKMRRKALGHRKYKCVSSFSIGIKQVLRKN